MTKRFSVVAIALAVALTAVAGMSAETPKPAKAETKSSSEKAPRLTIIEPLKDFGTVAKGDKLDWSFQIKNTGTSDLEILSVNPSCGCTVADFDKLIKPGQVGKVTAHVDTNLVGVGPTSKHITVQSNDPNTPSAQLTIHATVKPYVEAYPAGFVRYNILQGSADTKYVTLYSEETEPFEIQKIETPGDHVKVVYKKVEKKEERAPGGGPEQNQYHVAITLGGPTAAVGPLAEKVRIITNSKHQPEYLLTLTGVVRASYTVIPNILNFGEIAASDAEATRTVIFKTNDTKAPAEFKVTSVEASDPNVVAAEIKPTETPGMFEVIVKLLSNNPGAFEGNLKVHTSDSTTPIFTLPIKGTVKKSS